MTEFRTEVATQADDPELRQIYGGFEMQGAMEVAFQRNPDFFWGAGVQGPFTQVAVTRDTDAGCIASVATRSVRSCFVNGEARSVGYLGDVRIRPQYRSSRAGALLARYLEELHQDGLTNLYFSAIFEANRRAITIASRGVFGMPRLHSMSRFSSYVLRARRSRSLASVDGLEVTRGSPSTLTGIVSCLNRNGARKQFASSFREQDFHEQDGWLRDLSVEDFLVARRNDEVVGVAAHWDQRRFKQTLVSRYAGLLGVGRPFINAAGRVLGYPPYPRPGRPARSSFAALVSVDDDDPVVFRLLMMAVGDAAADAGCDSYLVGLHEDDRLRAGLQGLRAVPIPSRLYCACFRQDADACESLDGRVPHIEIAML